MTVAVLPSLNQVQMVNGDVRTIQTNRTWGQFRSLKQGFENTRGVRLAYYKGTIEILMLGLNHELFKSIIAITSLMRYNLDREYNFSLEAIDAALLLGLTSENCGCLR
jgi:hypothetical protein